MPDPVRVLHSPHGEISFTGLAQVAAADSRPGAIIARLFHLPQLGRDIPVKVTIVPDNLTEKWHRRFGASGFSSILQIDAATGRCIEQFGAFRFMLDVKGHERGLDMKVIAVSWKMVRLPGFLRPWTRAFERVDAAGRFTFDVEIGLRGIGRLVRYRGWLSA